MSKLETPHQVIDALGGTRRTAALLGCVPSAVSAWKIRNKLPAKYLFVIEKALGEQQVDPVKVFGIKPAPCDCGCGKC